jgi:electron transport complex protein RnfC
MSHSFYGGVHPPSFKTLTSDRPIKRLFTPKKVVIPLSQHTGSPAEPVVTAGTMVKVGDLIAKPSGHISAAVHASLSGKVTKIAYAPTHNQPRVLSVTIESQGDEPQEFVTMPRSNPYMLSVDEILAIIKDAGIVGLGGAAFPTYVKLSPPKTKPIDTVILNGAECEPYLTCDHRLMVERAKEILRGLDIIMKVLGVKSAYIAIEDNKLASIYAMEQALEKTMEQKPKTKSHRPKDGEYRREAGSIKIAVLKTKYPQGAEKQIIKAILGREVPAGGLPMDVGCVVQNVGTAYAIYEAVFLGKPLIERVITITGSCVREPMNIWVKVGTLLSDLAPVFGGFTKEPKKVIVGGPMMGAAQFTMDVPISKGVSGVVFLSAEEVRHSEESVCIRCGKCIEICPMGLVPTALMYRVKKEVFTEAKELGIANCYECGACAYACPAKIPLLDYMKYGKAKIPKNV